MNRRAVQAAAIVAVAAFGVWLLFVALPRRYRSSAGESPAAPAGGPAAAPERKITATLYYIAEDGMALVGVQREVPFGEPVAEQARRIVDAQLAAAPAPLAAAVPDGTTLRGVYVAERHTGGALDELFTIYAIVDAVTVNLPAISRVQILVDGKEVDTLAGHVDLRHPLENNLKWVKTEKED